MDREQERMQEAEFLAEMGDAAAVYRFGAGKIADRSKSLERMRLSGGNPIESGYDLIATGPIMQGADTVAMLDEYRANGFVKPGDIVAFKQAGALSCWSVDQFAYSRLPGLLENPLKTAELGMEQNYDQIDGIINNEAPKPSLRDDLKQCQQEADGPLPGKQIQNCTKYVIWVVASGMCYLFDFGQLLRISSNCFRLMSLGYLFLICLRHLIPSILSWTGWLARCQTGSKGLLL